MFKTLLENSQCSFCANPCRTLRLSLIAVMLTGDAVRSLSYQVCVVCHVAVGLNMLTALHPFIYISMCTGYRCKIGHNEYAEVNQA